MGVEAGFAVVNGIRLYYEIAGEGTPVVLIHGFTLDTRMWDDQFMPLTEHFRVLRYDARGFGRSDPSTGEPYAHHDDLQALLVHLGLGPAVVIGLSMGGGIAANFALAHPDLTRALVLIDAVLGGYGWSSEWAEAMAPVGRAARGEGIPAGKARWLAHPLFVPAHEQAAVGERLAAMIGDYSGWHWVNRDPVLGLDPPALGRMGAVSAPVLVLVGERDLPDFLAIADAAQQEMPEARGMVVPGVGHMANMEAPEVVNRAILDFLRDVL